MADVFDLKSFQDRKENDRVHDRWVHFYQEQPHDELLEALVFEHENGFPLRSSDVEIDRLRHKAMIQVLGERAQTEFLQSFLDEIR